MAKIVIDELIDQKQKLETLIELEKKELNRLRLEAEKQIKADEEEIEIPWLMEVMGVFRRLKLSTPQPQQGLDSLNNFT